MFSKRAFLAALVWIVLAFMLLPGLVVIPLSFSSVQFFSFPPPGWSIRWYANFAQSEDWRSAFLLSAIVGMASTIVSLVIGLLASFALARSSFRGKALVSAILLSPLMIPTIIIAIALYFLFVPFRLIGSPIALILGHVVIATPYVIVTMVAALERFDVTLERAAQVLGASPLRTFFLVTFPLLRPAVLSAAFLSFLASFDELIISLFLGGTHSRTLQVQMWRGIRFENDPTIAAVSTLLIVLSLAVFLFVNVAQSRSRQPVG